MITDIEDYFTLGCGRCDHHATPACSTRAWIGGLTTLRDLCRQAGLAEVVKWGHPCYMHAGRNICILGAFRGDFRMTFFNPGLMRDPEGLLQRQGANTRFPDALLFRDPAAPAAMAPVILAYLTEAMGYAAAGITQDRAPQDLALPDELLQALDDDPELAEAFAALTPGRRKSYVLALASAKAPATRMARIARFRPKILSGKGATEL